MLDKTLRMNYLFDFYQPLLTDKQQNYMTRYYLDDYSLGEIADEYEVSRQAVYDNIRRTETMLEDYEAKLGLLEKFEARRSIFAQLRDYAKNDDRRQLLNELADQLEKLD
ncbi:MULTISPECIES: putative DNA-binding protein [Bacillaceae]|uniref:UPF0122 protein AN965_05410 n=1 Tax=Alkalicoccobacillus plakortidis TaxID=444060 RepID=A0A9D5I2V8_9BACI|nr:MULTISPECIES: putative DNA-binding protein [Bacillaceae]KQL58209.1 hypothetical protein AN965_05410 [Alkalicoccobacillus plakortidis]